MNIFLDESGYTGPDLINRDQPVFILASTIIDEIEASALLRGSFGRTHGEVKYSKLSNSRRGRDEILAFLAALGLDRGLTTFWAVHKEFILFTHLIDFWLEPMAYCDGVNLYERGANIALANVGYLTLGTCLGIDGRRELMRQFQVMTRDRSPFAYHSFWDALRDAIQEHDLIEQAMGGLLASPVRLGYTRLLEMPDRMLDLGDYGLLEAVSHWRSQMPDKIFNLIHDESKMVRDNQEFWEAILDPSNPEQVVGQDRRTISFPLPVAGLQLVDSEIFPQLQVADLIAGAAREILSARVMGRKDDYCDALVEAGIPSVWSGGVWPTNEVTPEGLGTTGSPLRDAAEFISTLLERRRSQAKP